MAKAYYCSVCGIELGHSRRAVPGKGLILDLIDPHECEGHSVKSNPDEAPTVTDVIETLEDLHKAEVIDEKTVGHINVPGDRRDEKDKKNLETSSAPENLLKNFKGLPNTEPEGEME